MTEFSFKTDIVVLDVETTGFSAYNDEITEIAMVKLDGKTFEVVGQFQTLIKIDKEISKKVTELTGITNEMCNTHGMNKEIVKEVVTDFVGDSIVVAHNAPFDFEFLKVHFGLEPKFFYDTLTLSRATEPDEKSHALGNVCERRGINLQGAHRALNDVFATKELLYQLLSNNSHNQKLINHLSNYRLRYRPKNLKGVV